MFAHQYVSWSEALGNCLVHPEGIGGFQSDIECNVYICKHLYVSVVLPSGTNMNMSHEVSERMTNVLVSAMKVKVVVVPHGEIIAVGGKTLPHTRSFRRPTCSQTVRSSLSAQTLPLRGIVVPAEDRAPSHGGRQTLPCAEGSIQPITYELPDGNTFVIGADRLGARR